MPKSRRRKVAKVDLDKAQLDQEAFDDLERETHTVSARKSGNTSDCTWRKGDGGIAVVFGLLTAPVANASSALARELVRKH